MLASMSEAFLNDVACKFVVAQLDDLAFDGFDDSELVLGVLTLLQDMLNHIVSKLVVRQGVEI